MGRQLKFIQDPGAMQEHQGFLFPELLEIGTRQPWPIIRRTYEGFYETLEECGVFGYAGFDLEFSGPRPTIIGISSPSSCASLPWDSSLARAVVNSGAGLVGHSVVEADRPVLEQALGIRIPLERLEDSMMLHFICNADFCKQAGKEEEDEGQSFGYMNLWTTACMTTDMPQWKYCRGMSCNGPCPKHDVFGYNAVDAYASIAAFVHYREFMRRNRIPWDLYRRRMRLMEMCWRMQEQGLFCNLELADKMGQEMEEDKNKLYEHHFKGISPEVLEARRRLDPSYTPDAKLRVFDSEYSPTSPKQVMEFFSRLGVNFKKGTDKDEIKKALARHARSAGYSMEDLSALEWRDVEPSVLRELNRLYLYKVAGKGLEGWFSDNYMGKDGLFHPRVITTGSSLSRLAMSRPNFQNIPKLGFGANVRRVIQPRSPEFDLVKADYSQLELRKILHAAGIEQPKGDAFKWLVEKGAGLFEAVAEEKNQGLKPGQRPVTPRDITKSVSHGASYMEGVMLYSPYELNRPNIKAQINAGALVVTKDWMFRGKHVCFTGANLAERLFGDRTNKNRAKALKIQEAYFERFALREKIHKVLSAQIEDSYVIRNASGWFLRLYGQEDKDDLKVSAACIGQGEGAAYVQEGMLLFGDQGYYPILQVHDELVFEVPKAWTDKQCYEFMIQMVHDSKIMPGFSCPVKVSRGPNWKDMREFDPKELYGNS